MKTIGEILREKRLLSQLSMGKLAKLAEVPAPYISNIENGKTTPTLQSLQKIFAALDLEIEISVVPKGTADPEKILAVGANDNRRKD